jgi:hypothetical protein
MRFEGRETKLGVRAWEGAVHHQEIEIRQDRREVAREARGPGAIGARFATALAARLLPVREEAQAPHAGNLRLTLCAGRLRAAEDEGDERAIRIFGRGRERGAQPCVAAAPAQCPGEARFGIVDSERPVDARGELAVDWPPDRVRAGERRVKGSGQLRCRGRSRECGEQHRSRVPHRDSKHRTLVSVFASRAAALGTTSDQHGGSGTSDERLARDAARRPVRRRELTVRAAPSQSRPKELGLATAAHSSKSKSCLAPGARPQSIPRSWPDGITLVYF